MSQGVECYSCLPKTAWPPTCQIESIRQGLKGKPDKKADQLELYRNLHDDDDLTIHLCWNKGTAEPRGSESGQCLIHLLKEAGLVSHGVGVEENEMNQVPTSIAAPLGSHIATVIKIRKGMTPSHRI